MREIKFRAWDKNDQMMYKVAELIMSDGGIDWNAIGDLAMQGWRGEAEFMQYTGLKDKNGVEIYEGDILKAGDRVQEVKWSDDGAGFYTDLIGTHDYSASEVIGNIYESAPTAIKESEKI